MRQIKHDSHHDKQKHCGPLARNQQPSAPHQFLHVTPEPHSSRSFTSSFKVNLSPLILYGNREIDRSAAGAGPKSGHLVIFGTRFIPLHRLDVITSTCCDWSSGLESVQSLFLSWSWFSFNTLLFLDRCYPERQMCQQVRRAQELLRSRKPSLASCQGAVTWRLGPENTCAACPSLQDLQVRVHLQPSNLHVHPTETLTGFWNVDFSSRTCDTTGRACRRLFLQGGAVVLNWGLMWPHLKATRGKSVNFKLTNKQTNM